MGLAGRVWAEIGADASGLKKGVNDAITTLGNLGKTASSAGASGASALAGLGLGAISLQSALMLADRAAQTLKDTWEFAEQGAQITSLSQASSRLAQAYGGNMADIVSSVKEASFNTITEYDIMKGANLAMTMGISSNTTEISQLMQIAIERGRAFGLTTEEAFDRITRGIGRRSTKILDDLGFTANAIQANKEYAASIGISTNELTDNMKVRALFEMILKQGNAELAKQGGLMMDMSTPYQRLNTLYTEFMNKQKEFAASAALPFIASDEEIQNLYKQSAALALTSGNYEEYIKYAGYARTSYGNNRGSLSEGTGMSKEDFDTMFDGLNEDIEKLSSMSGVASEAFGNFDLQLSISQQNVSDSIKDFGDFNSMLEQAWESSTALTAAIQSMPSYKKIIIEIEQRTKGMTADAARYYGQYYQWKEESLNKPGGMHGGSFIGMAHGGIVPPGFSNDGMPIWVSSGERVDVTPAGNKSVDGQGGNTMRFYGPVTFKVDKDIRTTNLMEQLRQ